MKGYVYILRDSYGKLYVGSTTNINKRLKQHFAGHTQTTRNMASPELVFTQEYTSNDQARKVEMKLKSLKRKDYLEKIINDGYIKLVP
jgi:putative endonuclease